MERHVLTIAGKMNLGNMPDPLADILRFADVPVLAEVRIGSRDTTVKEIVGLRSGGLVLLDKPVGETLDLLIGGIKMASVEIIVVDDRLSVRVTGIEGYQPQCPTVEAAA
jgi:flagellar motor switch/type III secretory pathway protein FliN